MSDAYHLEVKGLDQLLKALKVKPPTCRVGILGSHTNRKSQGSNTPTNAEIGAAHEFGAPSRGLPIRSFLRMPLSDHLNKELERSGALTQAEFKEVIRSGSVLPWLKKVAVVAEDVIRKAFDTGGYGKWTSWKNSSYSNNANMLLVDTTQLRDSITSEVKE